MLSLLTGVTVQEIVQEEAERRSESYHRRSQ